MDLTQRLATERRDEVDTVLTQHATQWDPRTADTLAAHRVSADSWGWHCSCGVSERLSDLPVDPAVIHYVVGLKPWAGRAPMGLVWESYREAIGDLVPRVRSGKWKRRVSRWNTRRKVVLGAILGRPKYRVRLQVERAMREIERALAARAPRRLSGH